MKDKYINNEIYSTDNGFAIKNTDTDKIIYEYDESKMFKRLCEECDVGSVLERIINKNNDMKNVG
jgi:hypothetical protein